MNKSKSSIFKNNAILFCIIIISLQKTNHCLSEEQQNSNLIKFIKENDSDKTNQPRILTKYVHVTTYEHHTVVLPCEVLNLPNDMHIIWQYGKRGSDKPQTVLTIGRTQIENNYRVRVITNSTNDDDTGISFNYYKSLYYSSTKSSADDSMKENENNFKITSNNLEIRKLQLGDSGWYECQLPTKPTQINYVYLEVLNNPKIEPSTKHFKLGDSIELTCQVKNLPSRFELYWTLNDKKIIASYINKTHDSMKQLSKQERRLNTKILKSNDLVARKRRNSNRSNSNELFVIVNDKINNLTLSKLRIINLNEKNHKGIYRCKYDKLEAKYHLDFKQKDSAQKMKHQILKNDKDEEYSNNITSGALTAANFIKIKTVTIILISHFLFK